MLLPPSFHARLHATLHAISADELRGICDEFAELHHFVTFEYLAAWVYYHELAHTDLPPVSSRRPRSCTGLVVSGEATSGASASGTITHVANMDQSPEAVRNVTLRVHIVRGSVVVAEGVDWCVDWPPCCLRCFALYLDSLLLCTLYPATLFIDVAKSADHRADR